MNPFIEFLQSNLGTALINEDGVENRFELLPALSESEVKEFEHSLPCPLPAEIRELLSFAQGFKGGALEEVTFGGPLAEFGIEEIFPHAITLAGDGFGNFWVIDLTSESETWGPVFYACHDAPVIVYQCDDLLTFIEEAIRFSNRPWKSTIDDVHEGLSNCIWRENPGVLSYEDCLASEDSELKEFAKLLDSSWQIVDLRNARVGDGFSWGRYGPQTTNKRFGEKRIFAYQKRGWRQRFVDAWR